MEPLIIAPTETSPKVSLNPETPINNKYLFEISGESTPDNAKKFYSQIIDWFDGFNEYCKNWYISKLTTPKIRIKFKFAHLDSSSKECISDIIYKLEKLHNTYPEIEFKIIWVYDEGNENIINTGTELKKITNIPFFILLNYLHIDPTSSSPKVIINTEKKIFEISGRSFPANGMNFFTPVLEWIDKYGRKYFDSDFNFIIKLHYFNTSTAKSLHEIFKKLDSDFYSAIKITINWYYDDDNALEDGREFAAMFKIPFTFIEYEGEALSNLPIKKVYSKMVNKISNIEKEQELVTEVFIVEATDISPEVKLIPIERKFEISGDSRPENVKKFYEPILQWIDKYGEFFLHNSNFTFNLEYFNTSTTYFVIRIIEKFQELSEKGIFVNILWYYTDNDDREDIEVSLKDITMPIHFVQKM